LSPFWRHVEHGSTDVAIKPEGTVFGNFLSRNLNHSLPFAGGCQQAKTSGHTDGMAA
tara:strand:- start:51 stop:221 length:171 start_codon:yes stop_codon:yes gene_type:complete